MKATISLDGILSLIHAFSLDADSKRWLAEKLIEEVKEEKKAETYPCQYTIKELEHRLQKSSLDKTSARRFGVYLSILALEKRVLCCKVV